MPIYENFDIQRRVKCDWILNQGIRYYHSIDIKIMLWIPKTASHANRFNIYNIEKIYYLKFYILYFCTIIILIICTLLSCLLGSVSASVVVGISVTVVTSSSTDSVVVSVDPSSSSVVSKH